MDMRMVRVKQQLLLELGAQKENALNRQAASPAEADRLTQPPPSGNTDGKEKQAAITSVDKLTRTPPSGNTESGKKQAASTSVVPASNATQPTAVEHVTTLNTKEIKDPTKGPSRVAVDAYPVDGAGAFPGANLEGTTDKYFRQQIASFAALEELTNKRRGTLEEIKVITAWQANSLSDTGVGNTAKQQENLRELDNLVKMAKVLQEMAVSSADII